MTEHSTAGIADNSAERVPAAASSSDTSGLVSSSVDGLAGDQTFYSILFDVQNPPVDAAVMPACFRDLNLDQVVDAVTAGHGEYDLAPLYYSSLVSAEAVSYRQEVGRDIDGNPLRSVLEAFGGRLRDMRRHLQQAAELRHRYQRGRWFADAAQLYCTAVTELSAQLAVAELTSAGFQAFRRYVAGYVASGNFLALATATASVKQVLAQVRYCLNIRGSRVTVTRYDGEADYSDEVQATFARFRHGEVKNYLVKFYVYAQMNHVEFSVLELVAKLYPDTFTEMDRFSERWGDFQDPALVRFDREVQFYLAYLTYLDRVRRFRLPLCYPTVTAHGGPVFAHDTFDLALADKLAGEKTAVVVNDIDLSNSERILVVSGPNQGGKTTLARTFGQIHFLASLGLPVPGSTATLPLFDTIFTHFEREETLEALRGKLQDDLIRIHDILAGATGHSIIIMNELFTSTTLQDAVFLGTKIVEQVIDLNALCVYVTFVDELTLLGPTVVSMVSTVAPGHPENRTYRICRRRADGQAHAVTIAEKYRLTYPMLKTRLKS